MNKKYRYEHETLVKSGTPQKSFIWLENLSEILHQRVEIVGLVNYICCLTIQRRKSYLDSGQEQFQDASQK